MSYKVIKLFTDLQDGGYRYEVGDTYPREGYTPSEKRIAELSGSRNKQGTPLIEAVEETVTLTDETADETTAPAVRYAEESKPRGSEDTAETSAEDITEETPKRRSRHRQDKDEIGE